jgi:hypothetical protein
VDICDNGEQSHKIARMAKVTSFTFKLDVSHLNVTRIGTDLFNFPVVIHDSFAWCKEQKIQFEYQYTSETCDVYNSPTGGGYLVTQLEPQVMIMFFRTELDRLLYKLVYGGEAS